MITIIKVLFGDSQGGAPGFQGWAKAPTAPPKCNPDNYNKIDID